MPVSAISPRFAPQDNDAYRNTFRRHVFGILSGGYGRLNCSKYQAEQEPAITGELVRGMREFVEAPSAPTWATRYAIHDDPPINSGGGRLGKKRLRFDIQFERTCAGKRPRYGFEAKRLSGSSFGVKKYLEKEGLGAFLDGNYAAEEVEAGMIGYIQSDSESEWVCKIEQGMKDRKSALQFCSDGEWKEECVVKQLPFCFRTRHKRPTVKREISVYHLMLLFK